MSSASGYQVNKTESHRGSVVMGADSAKVIFVGSERSLLSKAKKFEVKKRRGEMYHTVPQFYGEEDLCFSSI